MSEKLLAIRGEIPLANRSFRRDTAARFHALAVEAQAPTSEPKRTGQGAAQVLASKKENRIPLCLVPRIVALTLGGSEQRGAKSGLPLRCQHSPLTTVFTGGGMVQLVSYPQYPKALGG